MVQKAGTKLTFKEAWTFPYEVEKRIVEFVEKHKGLWLHAPVGTSKIATGYFKNGVRMLTLDINSDLKPDIVCDIFKMTEEPTIKKIVEAGGFDGVISDPLWDFSEQCPKCDYVITNRTKGLTYPKRRYLGYQVRDVLKPGGWWVFNGLWNPKVKGLQLTDPQTNPIKSPIEIPMQSFSSFRNVSLLVYCQKINQRLSDV